jgi:ABC-type sugar transport system ATPase subunit
MRSGRTVATLDRGTWSADQLAHLMTGTERVSEERHRGSGGPVSSREKLLSVRNLQLAPSKKPIDLDVEAGELIGLAGLEGHGQDEFLEALAGRIRRPGEVVRHSPGADHPIRSARQASRRQVAYVPRDRGQSTFRWMSVRENFGMPTLSEDTVGAWLQPRRTLRRLMPYITQLRITLREPTARITTLSGGNQQKIVIARWLAAAPKVLLLNDPTRGVDVGAKHDLYGMLDSLTSQGVAIVMLSTELDEHVKLMDRVLVFREHELSAELEGEHLTRVAIVAKFFDKAEDTIVVA